MSTIEGILKLKANKTKQGKRHALLVFEMYLKHIEHEVTSFDECEESFLCSQNTLNKFAQWLLQDYKNNEEKVMKSGSAKQYLSGLSYIMTIIIFT
jgi:hypothetical protein